MTEGIWATWYDLPADDVQRYLAWAHGSYLPFLQQQVGIRWVAHYAYAGGGPQMARVKETVVSHTVDEVGHGSQYLMLAGASGVHGFFAPSFADLAMPETFAAMLSLREGLRTAAFTLEAGVDGPSCATLPPNDLPSPAIQMGTLRPRSIESEFDLIKWYAQYRLPSMAQMRGSFAPASGLALQAGPSMASCTSSSRSLTGWNTSSGRMNPWLWTPRTGRTRSHARACMRPALPSLDSESGPRLDADFATRPPPVTDPASSRYRAPAWPFGRSRCG